MQILKNLFKKRIIFSVLGKIESGSHCETIGFHADIMVLTRMTETGVA